MKIQLNPDFHGFYLTFKGGYTLTIRILYLQGKIQLVIFGKILWLAALRHAFERIVFELPAVVAGSDKAALGAEIRFVVELPGVDTVGAESVDLFSEQHAGHLLFCYYTAAWRKFPARIFRRRGASSAQAVNAPADSSAAGDGAKQARASTAESRPCSSFAEK